MNWLVPALAAPLCYAIANLTDTVLANRRMPAIPVLLFYLSFFNILYVPAVFLIDPPHWPTAGQLPILLLLAATNTAYLFPYYRALQTEQTSIVTNLFSLGKIFVPVLAFLFVHEVLSVQQYISFAIILISSLALTFRPKQLKLSPAFAYMVFASFIVSVEVVAFKYAFEELPWGTVFAWEAIFSFLFLLPLGLIPRIRSGVRKAWPAFRSSLGVISAMELFTFAAMGLQTYAISLAPVTLVSAVVETSPFFTLLIASVGKSIWPDAFKEQTDRRSIAIKLLWFVLTLFGILLLAQTQP